MKGFLVIKHEPESINSATNSASNTHTEPTSGLDSCSALAVVEHLRDRARESGITVVASIHQPRAAVWACFDACALLSGGYGMYCGPCTSLVDWFQGSMGYGPWDSAIHGTASDWVMDLINVGFTKGEVSRRRSVLALQGTMGGNPTLGACCALPLASIACLI